MPLTGIAPLITFSGRPNASRQPAATSAPVRWPPAEWPPTKIRSGSMPCSAPWRQSQAMAARIWRTISSSEVAGASE